MFSTTTVYTLQNFSYISQIISGFSILVIMIQVIVSIKDIKIRSKREAGVVSLQQAEKFAKEIIPIDQQIIEKLDISVPKWKGKKMTIFSKQEFDKEMKESIDLAKLVNFFLTNREDYLKVNLLLNNLEAMSLCFIGEIGDEFMAFSSISDYFCSIVERYSFHICIARDGDRADKMYKNIIELYNLWSDRINKINLEKDLEKLRSSISKIDDKIIKPLGV